MITSYTAGQLFETGLTKFDIIGHHDLPTPYWVYRIVPGGYAMPEKQPTLELAIEWVNKQGGEVSAINPWPVPSVKLW